MRAARYAGADGRPARRDVIQVGMAKNLKTKGHPLAITAFRKRERVADLLAAGAKELPDPAAMARACDVVFLCVTGSPQVEEVVAGLERFVAGASKGLIIIDTSTSEPDSTTRMRELAAAKGVSFIDAPLARTPVEAEAGKLNVMVGASAEDFARIEAIEVLR